MTGLTPFEAIYHPICSIAAMAIQWAASPEIPVFSYQVGKSSSARHDKYGQPLPMQCIKDRVEIIHEASANLHYNRIIHEKRINFTRLIT